MALEVPEFAQALPAGSPDGCGTVRPHADGKLHAGVPQQNLDAESNASYPDNPVVLGLAVAECQAGLRGRPALVDVSSMRTHQPEVDLRLWQPAQSVSEYTSRPSACWNGMLKTVRGLALRYLTNLANLLSDARAGSVDFVINRQSSLAANVMSRRSATK